MKHPKNNLKTERKTKMKTLNAVYCGPICKADPPETRVHPSPMMDYYEKRQAAGRGGYRPGSGRKKGAQIVSPEMRRVPVQIRLPQFMLDWMNTQNQSITKTIQYAIEKLIQETDAK